MENSQIFFIESGAMGERNIARRLDTLSPYTKKPAGGEDSGKVLC